MKAADKNIEKEICRRDLNTFKEVNNIERAKFIIDKGCQLIC